MIQALNKRDLSAEKKKTGFKGVALVFGGALFGGVVASLTISALGGDVDLPTISTSHLISMIALMALSVGLAPLLHEVGHLVGGRLAGYRFMGLIWGPIRLLRTSGRLEFGFNKSLSLAGGIAICVPQDGVSRKRELVLFIAGGPAASLLVGAAALGVVVLAFPPSVWVNSPTITIAGLVMGVFGLASLAIGFITSLPIPGALVPSDGAQLLRLAKGGAAQRREAAVRALTGLSLSGEAPENWPSSLIDDALSTRDESTFTMAALTFAYQWEMGRGNLERARDYFDDALQGADALPKFALDDMALEAAWFEVCVREDKETAAYWLSLAKGGPLETKVLRELVEALVNGTGVSAAVAEIKEHSNEAWRADCMERLVGSHVAQ